MHFHHKDFPHRCLRYHLHEKELIGKLAGTVATAVGMATIAILLPLRLHSERANQRTRWKACRGFIQGRLLELVVVIVVAAAVVVIIVVVITIMI